jgi:predicted nucleic acid-binding protein
VRFWDTSAIVPLLTREAGTSRATKAIEDDPEMIVWWGTRIECVSALARYAREHGMEVADLARASERLAVLADRWSEILPGEALRSTAERILRTHPLRAADAMQLAAALVASDDQPGTLPFISLDARQRDAARREGFPVFPETMPGPRLVRERVRQRGGRTTRR